nr:Gfo/Idh/MocA family oxidoreductase [Streptomyces bauhiniae]
MRPVDELVESGRGLRLIQATAARWGACPSPGAKASPRAAHASALYLQWLSGQPPHCDRPVRPLAVLDTDAARSAVRHLPGARAARPRNLDRLLTHDRPDLVVVATLDTSQREYVLRALAAGRTTFVEKPLATTTEDALALVRAAKTSPGRLLVGHNLRFTNLHAHLDLMSWWLDAQPVAVTAFVGTYLKQ